MRPHFQRLICKDDIFSAISIDNSIINIVPVLPLYFSAERESCCSLAPSGTQCRNRCEAVFDHPFPGHDMSLDVEIFCTDVNRQILQCVTNYTKVAIAPPNPRDSKYIPNF